MEGFSIEPRWGSLLFGGVLGQCSLASSTPDSSRQGARALKREIRDTQVNAAPLVAWLKGLAAERECEFLRAYWYDGEFDPSDARYATQRRYFDAIHDTPGIMLRLGYLVERTPGWHHAVRQAILAMGADLAEFERHFTFKPDLTQKGVDALITLDLVNLTSAYSWAVLVAGDKDLVDAVWTAQDEGCRVALALPPRAGLARELRRQADELLTIPDDVLRAVLAARRPRGEPPRPAAVVASPAVAVPPRPAPPAGVPDVRSG